MIRSPVMDYRLAAFDNDGTLHPAKAVWHYLQKPLGLWDGAGRALLRSHLAGEMNYTDMVRATIARWANRTEAEFLQVLEGMPLRPQSLNCLAALRTAELRIVVYSSGVHWWEQVWRTKYKQEFDAYLSNVVEVDATGLVTGQVTIQVTDDAPHTNKGHHLAAAQAAWGIPKEATLAFGDGVGDISMFQQAGRAFCVDPSNAEVRSAANGGELTSGDWRQFQIMFPDIAPYWPE